MAFIKLPPGEAIGARDLQKWATRRMSGKSGVGLDEKLQTVVCKMCGHKMQMFQSKRFPKCPRCGEELVKLTKRMNKFWRKNGHRVEQWWKEKEGVGHV